MRFESLEERHEREFGYDGDAGGIAVCEPLSHDEAIVIADCTQSTCHLDGCIEDARNRHAPRGHRCGRFTLSLRSKTEGRRTLHTPARCKRYDCPYCLRRRTVRDLSRARDCLPFSEVKSNEPRRGALYVWRGSPEEWDMISRRVRRAETNVGHVRVFTKGGECVVVSEAYFADSDAVSVVTAAVLLADAIQDMAWTMHSVRWLGRWRKVAVREMEWECYRHSKSIGEVKDLAKDLGGFAYDRLGKTTVLFSPEHACKSDQFWLALQGNACPSLEVLDSNNSILPDLDNASVPSAGECLQPSGADCYQPYYDDDGDRWNTQTSLLPAVNLGAA